MTVYGLGRRKTPEAVRRGLRPVHLPRPARPGAREPTPRASADEEPAPPPPNLKRILSTAISSTSKDDGWSNLGEVGSYLVKSHAAFDPRDYGHTKLGELVRAESYVEVKDVPGPTGLSQLWVRLKPRGRRQLLEQAVREVRHRLSGREHEVGGPAQQRLDLLEVREDLRELFAVAAVRVALRVRRRSAITPAGAVSSTRWSNSRPAAPRELSIRRRTAGRRRAHPGARRRGPRSSPSARPLLTRGSLKPSSVGVVGGVAAAAQLGDQRPDLPVPDIPVNSTRISARDGTGPRTCDEAPAEPSARRAR